MLNRFDILRSCIANKKLGSVHVGHLHSHKCHGSTGCVDAWISTPTGDNDGSH